MKVKCSPAIGIRHGANGDPSLVSGRRNKLRASCLHVIGALTGPGEWHKVLKDD